MDGLAKVARGVGLADTQPQRVRALDLVISVDTALEEKEDNE